MVGTCPGEMDTVWQGGATNLGAQPKPTVCIPAGNSVDMPQLSCGTASTVTLAGTSGLMTTVKDPLSRKFPVTDVSAPAETVTACAGGPVKPSTCVNATV